jgi:hypothetical protein
MGLAFVQPTLAGYSNTLTLENKNPATWAAIVEQPPIQGTLNYNSSGNTFDFSFTATGLAPSTSYDLIYYADFADKTIFGGNNPGGWIATFTTDGAGVIPITTGSVNLGMDLPCSPDANMTIHCYTGAPDYYPTCHGAKIWLVPSDNYTLVGKKVNKWNPTAWLFETDLVNYTDLDDGAGSIDLTTTVIPGAIGMTVAPVSLAFGSVAQGSASAAQNITLTNAGGVPIKVTATTSAGFYTECLQLSINEGITWVSANGWTYSPIAVGGSKVIKARVLIPVGYTTGTYTGTVSFMAQVAP